MRFSNREQSGLQQHLSTLPFTPSQTKDWFCNLSLHPVPVSRDFSAMGTDRPHPWSKKQTWGARQGDVFAEIYPAFRFSLSCKFLSLLFAPTRTHLQLFFFCSQEVIDERAAHRRLSAVFTLGHFSLIRNSTLPVTQVAGLLLWKAPAFGERW